MKFKIEMERKQREKLGDVIIDICKYTLTAVFIATWIKDKANDWAWYIHIPIAVGIFSVILYSLKLYKEDIKMDKGK